MPGPEVYVLENLDAPVVEHVLLPALGDVALEEVHHPPLLEEVGDVEERELLVAREPDLGHVDRALADLLDEVGLVAERRAHRHLHFDAAVGVLRDLLGEGLEAVLVGRVGLDVGDAQLGRGEGRRAGQQDSSEGCGGNGKLSQHVSSRFFIG